MRNYPTNVLSWNEQTIKERFCILCLYFFSLKWAPPPPLIMGDPFDDLFDMSNVGWFDVVGWDNADTDILNLGLHLSPLPFQHEPPQPRQPPQHVPPPQPPQLNAVRAPIFELLETRDQVEVVEGEVRGAARTHGRNRGTWLSVDIDGLNLKFDDDTIVKFRHVRSGTVFRAAVGNAPSSISGLWYVKLLAKDWTHFAVTEHHVEEIKDRKKRKKGKKSTHETPEKRDRRGDDNDEDENDDPSKKRRVIGERETESIVRNAGSGIGGGGGIFSSSARTSVLGAFAHGDLAYLTQKLNPEETFRAGEVVALVNVGHDDGLRVTSSPDERADIFAWSVVANRRDQRTVGGNQRPLSIADPGRFDDDDDGDAVPVVYMAHALVRSQDMDIASGDIICASPMFLGEAKRFDIDKLEAEAEMEETEEPQPKLLGIALSNVQEMFVDALVWVMRTVKNNERKPRQQRPSHLLRDDDDSDPYSCESETWRMMRMVGELDTISSKIDMTLIPKAEFESRLVGPRVEDRLASLEKRLSSISLKKNNLFDVDSLAKVQEAILRSRRRHNDDEDDVAAAASAALSMQKIQHHIHVLKEHWAQQLEKLEARAKEWDEMAVVANLNRDLRQKYSGFNLLNYTIVVSPTRATIPFEDVFIPRRLKDVSTNNKSEKKLNEIAFAGNVTKVTGSGKSSWCNMFCYKWAKGRKNNRSNKELDDDDDGLVILVDAIVMIQCMESKDNEKPVVTVEECLARMLFSGDIAKAKTFLQWSSKPESHVLWIIDQYEVLEMLPDRSEFSDNPSRTELAKSMLELMSKKSLIAATRDDNVRRSDGFLQWNQRFELAPFNPYEVCSFIYTYFHGVVLTDPLSVGASVEGRALLRRLWRDPITVSRGSRYKLEDDAADDNNNNATAAPTSVQDDLHRVVTWSIGGEHVKQLYEMLCNNSKIPYEPNVLAFICSEYPAYVASNAARLTDPNADDVFSWLFKGLANRLAEQSWSFGTEDVLLAWKGVQLGSTQAWDGLSFSIHELLKFLEHMSVEPRALQSQKSFDMVCEKEENRRWCRWKSTLLQDYLAADFLFSIRDTTEFRTECVDMLQNMRMERQRGRDEGRQRRRPSCSFFATFLGLRLSATLKETSVNNNNNSDNNNNNRTRINFFDVDLRMQMVVKFLLLLRQVPDYVKDAGRAVIECLKKYKTLLRYAQVLWMHDDSFARPWADAVACYGDRSMAMIYAFAIKDKRYFFHCVGRYGRQDVLNALLDMTHPTLLMNDMFGCGKEDMLQTLLDQGAVPSMSFFTSRRLVVGQYQFMTLTFDHHCDGDEDHAIPSITLIEALDVWVGALRDRYAMALHDEAISVVTMLLDAISDRFGDEFFSDADNYCLIPILNAASKSPYANALNVADVFKQMNDALGLSNDDDNKDTSSNNNN